MVQSIDSRTFVRYHLSMSFATRFSVPLVAKGKPEELYQGIKRRLSCPRYPLTNRRIFRLEMEHNGTIKVGRTQIEVGKRLYEGGEFVVAIFETIGWYLVCTKTRGALSGTPHYIDGQDVIEVVDF